MPGEQPGSGSDIVASYDPDSDLPSDLWRTSRWAARPDPPRPVAAGWLWLILGLVVVYNPVLNLLLPDVSHVVANLVLAGIILVVAWKGGVTWDNVGLRPGTVRRGVVVGLVVTVVIAAGVALVALLPFSREYFGDDRFIGMSTGEMLYESLVRIPFGTVLFEEFVFRGVVLGMLLRQMPIWTALLLGCSLFGLWHVIPSFDAIDSNPAGDRIDGPFTVALGVLVTVSFTAIVGAGFNWLRFRGNSLVTPILAHVATNSFAFIAGWLVVSNGWA